MKAAVKFESGPGNFSIREIPTPVAGDNEVLIALKVAAVCGADGLLYDWTYKGRFPVRTPLVLGHEGAGVIAETGRNVIGLKPGDRVTAESIIGCGSCFFCKRGMTNLCPQWQHVGITMNGTFAEYLLVPVAAIHRLPDAVAFAQGALVEPLAITANTFDRIKVGLGDSVLIVGPGVQGLLHTQAARAAGAATIIVAGLPQDQQRLEKARDFGADYVVVDDGSDILPQLLELTRGVGADVVIEVGGTPEAFKTALNAVRGGGQIAALGYSNYGELEPIRIARQQLSISGVIGFLPKHFEQALQWLESGKVDVAALVSHRLPLAEAEQGIKLMKDRTATKVLLEIG
jgi:2-desacetyl-2-hydroxyethyl bacteriochlorophyllide A dehydrogenase